MCLPAALCIFETSETNRESKAVSTSVQLAEPQAHTDADGGRPNSHQPEQKSANTGPIQPGGMN
jgi:hypothetical protein